MFYELIGAYFDANQIGVFEGDVVRLFEVSLTGDFNQELEIGRTKKYIRTATVLFPPSRRANLISLAPLSLILRIGRKEVLPPA